MTDQVAGEWSKATPNGYMKTKIETKLENSAKLKTLPLRATEASLDEAKISWLKQWRDNLKNKKDTMNNKKWLNYTTNETVKSTYTRLGKLRKTYELASKRQSIKSLFTRLMRLTKILIDIWNIESLSICIWEEAYFLLMIKIILISSHLLTGWKNKKKPLLYDVFFKIIKYTIVYMTKSYVWDSLIWIALSC